METIKFFAVAFRRLLLWGVLAGLGLTPAQAAITQVNSTSAISIGAFNSLTLTLPAASNVNDVLFAAVTHKSNRRTCRFSFEPASFAGIWTGRS